MRKKKEKTKHTKSNRRLTMTDLQKGYKKKNRKEPNHWHMQH